MSDLLKDVGNSQPLARVLAASVDFGIRLAVYAMIGIVFSKLDKVGIGLFLICIFAVEWGYSIAFEMYAKGATPGKMVMKLQVLNADGTPVGWHGSVLRNLLRIADFLPFGYALGIVSMSSTKSFQRLGDLAAGTVVCYTEAGLSLNKNAPAPEISYTESHSESVVISENLAIDEQAAIVSFAERSRNLGPERAQEIAAIIAPLSGSDSGKKNLSFLHGLANRILR